jgi:hypothetical protein
MSALSAVGLRYVTDSQPAIRRRRSGRGFTYLDVDGKRVKDPAVLDAVAGGEVGFEAVHASPGELKSAERSLLRFLKQIGRQVCRGTRVRKTRGNRGNSVLPRTSSV